MQISGVPQAFANVAVSVPAGAPSAPSKPKAKPLSPEAKRFEEEGNKLSKDLSRLVFEARNVGTLSVGPAKPAALKSRLEALEAQVMDLKRKLEGYIANPKAVGMEDIAGGRAIRFYFEQALKIVQVKAVIGDSVELGAYDFQIPYRLLEEMSGMTDPAASDLLAGALADPNGIVALDRSSLRGNQLPPNHPVKLQIGRKFAERFVLVAKTGMNDEQAFVLAIKAFAMSTLLEHWEFINRIRKNPTNDLPTIPPALAKELGVLGQPELTRAQRDMMQAEPERRAAIVKGFGAWFFERDKKGKIDPKADPKVLSAGEKARLAKLIAAGRASGLEFTDSAFLESFITAAIGAIPVSEENDKKKAGLVEALQTAEALNIQVGLAAAITDFSLPLAEMSHQELKRSLRKILAQAKFIAILPVLHTIKVPENRDAEVAAFFTSVKDAYIKRLESTREADVALDAWITASVPGKSDAQQKAHREFVEELIKKSLSVARDPKAPLDLQAEGDFETVAKVGRLSKEYRALPESTRGDLEMILKAKDWNKSVQAYRSFLTELATYEKKAREAKKHAAADNAAEEARALRKVAYQFALREYGDLPEKMRWIEVDLSVRDTVVTLSDRKKLNNSLLTLSLEKQVATEPDPITQEALMTTVRSTLYKELAERVRALPSSAKPDEIFSVGEEVIEQGLEILRSNIVAQLKKLGEVSGQEPKKQIQALLPLIAQSTLLRLEIPKAFPMLTEQLETAFRSYTTDLESRKVISDGQDALLKPMSVVMVLFTTRMLLFAFRGSRPFIRALQGLEMGFASQMQGLMIAAVPLMAMDLRLDWVASQKAGAEKEDMNRWFATSAESTSFYDYLSVMDSEAKAEAAHDRLVHSAVMQGLFLVLPVGAILTKAEFVRGFDAWKLDTFKRLGFTSPEVDAIVASANGKPVAEGTAPFTFNTQVIRARAQERGLQAEGERLIRFIEKQEKTARGMLRDFEREFRDLGIQPGLETLNLRKLQEALVRLEERYKYGEISLAELEKGRAAFREINRTILSIWGGTVSPIRQLYYRRKKIEPLSGPHEAFRTRLYGEVYGFADQGPPAHWFKSDGSLKDFYAELGLNFFELRSMTAALAQDRVKKAYQRASATYHPDRNSSAGAEEIFKAKKEANEVLRDFVEKSNYDLLWQRVWEAKGGKS